MIRRDEFPRRLLPIRRPQVVPGVPDRAWTADEWDLISNGLVAPSMDDRWDAIVEGGRLFLHRSWTGHGIFEAQFEQRADGSGIAWALVESDPDRYRRGSDELESLKLQQLIDGVILGRWDEALRQRISRLRT